LRDTGAFQFSFGFFDIGAVAGIDPVASKQAWFSAALASATEVFDDRLVNPGASATATIDGGTDLGFYLIPNNTLANFNASPRDFFPSQTASSLFSSPLSLVSPSNPGELDQMLSFVANGVTLFTFEDLTRTWRSDQDFTDLAFSIDAEPIPQINGVPEPSSANKTKVSGANGLPFFTL
jgi:hypothetical protein